ncbi:uncharacterized protein LOC119579386 [Penaeus monodon]|uniref:uncharacterized protein LOC119579386 n=1 Tax=Penaeus monodon TaxID=6687 RepID=UPI0018A6EAFF|nr:uncharacterized protein LOC119579386 [Penaeus monodon]
MASLAVRVLVLLLAGCGCMGERVYQFQGGGVQSDAHIKYTGFTKPVALQSVSFCVRLKFYFLWDVSGFLQLSNASDVHNLRAEVNLDYIRVTLVKFRRFHFLKHRLRALTWHHICVTYNDGLMISYLDGEEQDRQTGNLSDVITGNVLKVGSWDKENSFSGQLTQVNIWSRALSPREVVAIADCENVPEGDIVSWSGPWGKHGDVQETEESIVELCEDAAATDYFYFNEVTASSAFSICHGLGGSVPIPKTEKEYQVIQNVVEKYRHNSSCENFWVGITDHEQEGIWMEPLHNQHVHPIWSMAEPDGDKLENCAVASSPSGFSDSRCDLLLCVACAVPRRPVWSLLGACERHRRNTHLVASQDSAANLIFRGYSDYQIVQGKNVSEWLWWDWQKNETFAVLANPVNGIPVGRQNWTLKKAMCGRAAGESLRLLLTPCGEGFFSCDDATCIPLYQRCDLKFDCRDQSDESGCQLVRFPPVYRPDLPPAINYNINNNTTAPLPVGVTIVIESADVDTRSMHMHANLNVSVTWREARIDFLNLNEDYTLNRVPYETMQNIWTPVIDFTNTKGNHITMTDEEATMVVNMLGRPSLGDNRQPEEVEVYSGPENPLTVRRKYSITFQCQFDLKMYPFDQQYCDLELTMLSASSRLLVFDESATRALFDGNPQLVEYTVGEVDVEFFNEKDFAVIFVKVELLRRSGFIIMNVYIPSLCLLVISYLTLYFSANIFQVRVLASLTSLLVMATLFTQASSSLPKTSYFKMVDVWLLSSIFFIFIIIVLHTVIDRAREADNARKEPKEKDKQIKVPSASSSEKSNVVHPSDPGGVAPTLTEVNEPSQSCSGVSLCVPSELLPNAQDEGGAPVPLHEKIIQGARISVLGILLIFNFCYWIVVLV